MRILTICARGNSRSVILGWLLKDHLGHDAIAMGIESNSEETKRMLYRWAEKIILVDKTFFSQIPDDIKHKVKIWDVGGDRFFQPHPDLVNIYLEYLNKEGI